MNLQDDPTKEKPIRSSPNPAEEHKEMEMDLTDNAIKNEVDAEIKDIEEEMKDISGENRDEKNLKDKDSDNDELNDGENSQLIEECIDEINEENATNIISTEELELGKIPLPKEYDIKFDYCCKLFTKIAPLKPKEKVKCVKLFIDKFFGKAVKEKVSLFPFFRLLFPRYDRLRPTYGIAEVYLSNLYEDILQLPERDKLMLKHWKNPNFVKAPAPVGDYLRLFKYIIENRVAEKSNITLNEINEFLDKLAVVKDKNERNDLMKRIIKECSADEQKWIVAQILKDLKMGLSHETFFKNYDPRTIAIFNSTSSLVFVCDFLRDPSNPKYAETSYLLFAPIRPMLVARMTLDNIYNNFNGTNCLVETKWDGERIQCHLSTGNIKFYTRNGVDYTYLYGPKFATLIQTAVNARGVILDGEIVVYDKVNNRFAAFGDNRTIAKTNDESEKCLVYQIFDIIYLETTNGNKYPMNNVTLADRKKVLCKVVTPIPKRIELVLGTEVNNVDDIMNYFNTALKNGEEGIVIKKLDSKYQPDKRCSDWVKMKCDYIDTIVDTLDLIIIGGYYGNTRANCKTDFIDKFHKAEYDSGGGNYNENVTSFLMGIVRNLDEKNPKLSTILPLVRVGTGFNLQTLNAIRSKLKNSWKKYDNRMLPSIFGQWTPSVSDRPDVYIDDPSLSCILEIKAAEIIPTVIYPSKLTLRFARVVKPRFDKSWYEALKYDELLNFYSVSVSNVKKNNALFGGEGDEDEMQHKHIIKKNRRKDILNTLENNIIDDDLSSDISKMDKRKKRNEFLYKLLPSFRDTDTSGVSKISNLFQGCTFLVLLLDESVDKNSSMKQSIEYLIVEHGGEKVQNYLPSVTHIISNIIDFRAKNILKQNDVNVMKSKWVEDCVKYKKILKISPKYLTYANEQTKELFAKTIDIYGDSYFEEIDLNGLEGIFENIKIINLDVEYEKSVNKMMKEYENNEQFKELMVET